jgi:hypothetical protein
MAWMAGNIYLSTSDVAAVVKAAEGLLASPAHAADPENLLDAPAPLVVSPAYEGWIAITGARGFFDELPWVAAELSRVCGVRSVSCELIGNSYALRLATFESGERKHEKRTPEAGWSGGTAELAEMPVYEDAEKLALQGLREAGLPTPLAVIGTCPLAQPARRIISLGEGTSLRRPGADSTAESGVGSRGATKAPVEVRAPELPGNDPPVLPTGTGQDFGLMLFEDRYVEGRPTLVAVDRLISIEEDILTRAKRACPEAQVSLTVTYHGGSHQDVLDEELRARGRPTAAHLERGDRVPWWQFWRHFGRLR